MKMKLIIILIFICCAYLSLKSLDNTYFWDDEAMVGIVAKNFIASGHLTAWDGRNMLACINGNALIRDLQPNDSPLQYLITAASFSIFGVSTYSGRFPSVILGLLALLIFLILLRHDFNNNETLHIYALSLLAFSVIFLLNIRQCKYYALCLFFSLLTFYSYRKWLVKRSYQWLIVTTIAAILFFYSHFLLCIAFLFSLATLHLLFYRKALSVKEWRKLFIMVAVFLAATLPYVLINRLWHRYEQPYTLAIRDDSLYLRKLKLIFWNIRDLNFAGYLPWVVFAGLVYILIRYRKEKPLINNVLQWLVFSFGYLFFLGLFSHQHTNDTYMAEVRYLIPILPFLVGLTGFFIWFIYRKMKLLAVVLFLIIMNTNALALTPFNTRFRILLPDYIYEVHHQYPTCNSEAIDFLIKNAKQDDLVYAFPEIYNYPLMFYLTDKVRFCCLLNYKTPLPIDRVRKLSNVLFIEENFPEWFVVFGMDSDVLKFLSYFSRPHKEGGRTIWFKYYLAKILDVYCVDTSRPELNWHSFGPKIDFDRTIEAVYIFRRGEPIEVK